jgi:hypothetical protein
MYENYLWNVVTGDGLCMKCCNRWCVVLNHVRSWLACWLVWNPSWFHGLPRLYVLKCRNLIALAIVFVLVLLQFGRFRDIRNPQSSSYNGEWERRRGKRYATLGFDLVVIRSIRPGCFSAILRFNPFYRSACPASYIGGWWEYKLCGF